MVGDGGSQKLEQEGSALQFLKAAVEMIGFMETGKATEGSLCICWLMLRVLALP